MRLLSLVQSSRILKKFILLNIVFQLFVGVSCTEENLQIEQMKISKAKSEAEVLSYEVLVINAPQRSLSRGPASIESSNESPNFAISGKMGMDPWGQEYRYFREIIPAKNSEKTKTHVVVWSAGPNRKFEYDPSKPNEGAADDVVIHQSQ